MKRVILVCAMGMSTSLLVNKFQKAIKERNLEVEMNAYAEAELSDYIKDADLVLLAPQVGYLEDEISQVCIKNDKPWELIPMNIYASINQTEIGEYLEKILIRR